MHLKTLCSFLILIQFCWFVDATDLPSNPNSCSKIFTRQRPESEKAQDLWKIFHDYKFISSPGGIAARNIAGLNQVPRVVQLDAAYHRLEAWETEIWEYRGQLYQLIDVGYLNLEMDSRLISAILLDHMTHFAPQDLVIQFGKDRQMMYEVLTRYRWAVHEAVMDVYRREKAKYLSEGEMADLVRMNEDNQNNDVFALLRYIPGKHLSQLNSQEIKDNLVFTIQVTYEGIKNFDLPSVQDLISTGGQRASNRFSLFPFEYRLDPAEAPQFRHNFYRLMQDRHVAEFTRYARIGERVPRAVTARFLLNALDACVRRNIDTIIASTDSKTRQAYMQHYHFSLYPERMPVKQSVEEEYLLYVLLNSPNGRQLVSDLTIRSTEVRVKRTTFE